jgi:hypothetical protein
MVFLKDTTLVLRSLHPSEWISGGRRLEVAGRLLFNFYCVPGECEQSLSSASNWQFKWGYFLYCLSVVFVFKASCDSQVNLEKLALEL